jgi:hypothetical protein
LYPSRGVSRAAKKNTKSNASIYVLYLVAAVFCILEFKGRSLNTEAVAAE